MKHLRYRALHVALTREQIQATNAYHTGLGHLLGCILWAQKRISEKVEKPMDFRPRDTCPGKSDLSILWDEIILDQAFVKFWWRVLEETEKTSTKNMKLLFCCCCCSHQHPTQLPQGRRVAVDALLAQS